VSSLLSSLPRSREAVSIAPGALWLKNWLSLDQQSALVEQCRTIMDGPAGGYVPTVRGGGKMHCAHDVPRSPLESAHLPIRLDARRS
jgi:hypothetical protein